MSTTSTARKESRRLDIRRQLLLEAGLRYQQAAETGFKPAQATEKLVIEKRTENYNLREKIRDQIGMTEVFENLNRIEEAQIDTWDAVNFPPHQKAALAGRPVARIVDTSGEQVKGFATGFMISDKLLMTNFHVFPDYDDVVDTAANFGYEYDTNRQLQQGVLFALDPDAFYLAHRALDVAVVAVEPLTSDKRISVADFGFVQLIDTPGKIAQGDDVNIIQHPLGGHKQFACRQNKVIKIFEEGQIQYVTDTARASSGSPCYNKFWELAALHHCAIPLVRNNQIIDRNDRPWNGRDEDDIRWISNEGISISKIIAWLRQNINNYNTQNKNWMNDVLNKTGDPLLSASPVTTNSNGNGHMKVNGSVETMADVNKKINETLQPAIANPVFQFNFYASTTININVAPGSTGTTITTAAAEAPRDAVQPAAEEAQPPIEFDEDYDDRVNLGYDPDFLVGLNISKPVVQDERKVEMLTENGQVQELKYYNFSLEMNKARRFCMWTAVNVNYDPEVRSNRSRADFGRDTWRTDPRIPDALQVTARELYGPAKRVEQGHIVRREDACWGADEDFITFANSDTFHFTNCTPQLEPFNRANPRASEGYEGIHGIWGALEEHIKKELGNVDNLATIFAGPHLAKNDPVADAGKGKIKYPLKFWKVICVRDGDGNLNSFGFWLDQTDVVEQFGLGIEEALDFRKFKKQQIKISDITKRTKIEFDEKVYFTDVLKNNPINESNETVISYQEVGDIQVKQMKLDQ